MTRKVKQFETILDCGVLGELDVIIHYRYSPGTRDVMYLPNGDPGYPGDPAELEIVKVEWPYESANIHFGWDQFDKGTMTTIAEEITELEADYDYDEDQEPRNA